MLAVATACRALVVGCGWGGGGSLTRAWVQLTSANDTCPSRLMHPQPPRRGSHAGVVARLPEILKCPPRGGMHRSWGTGGLLIKYTAVRSRDGGRRVADNESDLLFSNVSRLVEGS